MDIKPLKFSLTVLNALWAILGFGVLLSGCFGWGDTAKYRVGTVVLGASILLISLLGFLGTIRQSARLLWSYVTLLVVLLVLVIVFKVSHKHENDTKGALHSVDLAWSEELVTPGAMNHIQQKYHCCGRYGSNDYINLGQKADDLPPSCCKDESCKNPANLYTDGCLSKVEEAFAGEKQLPYLEWIVLVFNVVLIVVAAILAIKYSNNSRRQNF